MMPVVQTASKGMSGSVVLLQPGAVSVLCAVARNVEAQDCKEQGSYSCSNADDCRHLVKKKGCGRLL